MIPTVEESLTIMLNKLGLIIDKDLKECLIDEFKEFAKLHVEAALKEASEKAEIITNEIGGGLNIEWKSIDKDSILNAYPLTNIK
jgi:hypothetical protein